MNEKYMQICLELALKNQKKNELPIAAMLVQKNKIISKCVNNKNINHNVLGHAEILCIKKASKKLKRWNLNDCQLYVTLKPCEMCEIIIREAHIPKTYYLIERLEHKKTYSKSNFIEIQGMKKIKEEYKNKLKSFFENRR